MRRQEMQNLGNLTFFFAGELVFGVARIFASFNDTFVHITDLRFVISYVKQTPNIAAFESCIYVAA